MRDGPAAPMHTPVRPLGRFNVKQFSARLLLSAITLALGTLVAGTAFAQVVKALEKVTWR